nr:hypothetical protein [Tanacetum cinerariifolium]
MEEVVNEIGEITFPSASGSINSSNRSIIKAQKSERQVNRVYIDRGSSCKVIYEHCFLKLKPSIKSLGTRSLVELLSTDLPTTYKGLIEKTYTCIKAKEVATNGYPNEHKESFDRFGKGFSWDNNKGKKKNRDRFSSYKGSNHGLLTNLSKSPRKILAIEKVAKTFEQPPRMVRSRRSHNMLKYCHFHEDHGHETNQCQELGHQIE